MENSQWQTVQCKIWRHCYSAIGDNVTWLELEISVCQKKVELLNIYILKQTMLAKGKTKIKKS